MGLVQAKEQQQHSGSENLLNEDHASSAAPATRPTPEPPGRGSAPATPRDEHTPAEVEPTNDPLEVGNTAQPASTVEPRPCCAGVGGLMKRIWSAYLRQRRRHNLQRDFDWAHRPFMQSYLWLIASIFLVCGANIAGFVVVMYFLPKDFPLLQMPSFEHSPHMPSLGKAIGWFFAYPLCHLLFIYRPFYAVMASKAGRGESDLHSINSDGAASLGDDDAVAPWVFSVVPPDVEVPPLPVRRQLWACVAMAFLSAAIVVCGIAIVGAERLGFAGVLFLINLHKSVATWTTEMQDKSGSEKEFFKLASGSLVAMQLWFVLAVMLGRRWWSFARGLLRSHAVAPVVCGVVTFCGVVAVYCVSIFFVPDATTNDSTTSFTGRKLCFKNSCRSNVWVGQIGGSTGIPCPGCPPGTVCNSAGDGLCHFKLPVDTPLLLSPSSEYCMLFNYDPVLMNLFPITGGVQHSLVQWSGSIYASGGCNEAGICETGLCVDCPPFRGPVGPVTQAEMTLQVDHKDYYDITIINGANFPMSITPINQGMPFSTEDDVPAQYVCGRPGATVADPSHPQTLATWSFTQPPPFTGTAVAGAPTTYAVVSGGSHSACPCSNGEVCGISMTTTSQGLPTDNVTGPLCGKLVGVWSDDELCGWTDAISYGWCKQSVPGTPTSTIEEMFQCTGTPYGASCFQSVATDACCGCEEWPSLALPSAMQCYGSNTPWKEFAKPRLEFLKNACPTCYTYPFDDATSLFTCRSNTSLNLNSYTIEWRPGGVEMQYQTN